MPSTPLSEARKQVRNAYGAAFASKASDALVLSIAQPLTLRQESVTRGITFAMGPPLRVSAEARGAVSVAVAPVAGPSTVIVELSHPTSGRKVEVDSAHPAWQDLAATLEKLGLESVMDASSVVRRLRATEMRDAFYQQVGSLREQIGRAANVRPETTASGTSRPSTQVCWLNSTLRTAAHLPTLAEVAHDFKVERIGLPRLLRRNADTRAAKDPKNTGSKRRKAAIEAPQGDDVLGAVAFRARTSLTGKGIVVAILDTEIAYKHAAFGDRVILKENYTREPWGHPDFHGTAVAGLLAAGAQVLTGIVPEVTIYHYKVLATAEENNADDFGGTLAIQQALEDGAQIANCSWGIGPAGNGTSREARAFDQAWDLGLVIVKSAGNDGERGLTSPADARGAIVVGATDRAGKKVIPQSSRGPAPNGRQVDCVAPGGSADDYLTSCQVNGKIGRVGFGTSFAAPQVAGLLALLLAEDRNRGPEALRAAFGELCRKLPRFDVKAQGRGLPVLS